MPKITQSDAQYCLLYSVVVAGKKADFARGVMERFLANADCPPFDWIAKLDERGELEPELRKARAGSYGRLTKSFRELAKARPDLLTATPVELEKFHGVGPKSARFAITWVRPKERFAALDTHVLKWLRFIGYDAPKSTPSGELYAQLETIFIAEADKRNLAPRLLDAMIWGWASTRPKGFEEWPNWLQKTPWPPPAVILAHFLTFAA